MHLRDYKAHDERDLADVALAAFEQYKDEYSDWPAIAADLARMGELAEVGEVIVAEHGGRIVGGVGYVGPNRPKAAYFDQAWPIIRMLVVAPAARGRGLGRRLMQASIELAVRDRAPVVALHTSPIMSVALPLYLRMGFVELNAAPDIYGVPCRVLTKNLAVASTS